MTISDSARILLVEDDTLLREAMSESLRDAGFVVESAPDGRNFADRVTAFRPDLAVLDVMLPGPADGLRLADHLRRHGRAAVLFVTARDAVADRLAGFDVGADDYVTKPVVLAELVARVRAVLRRSGKLRSTTVQVADLIVDEDAGVVRRAETPVAVTATELRLLAFLARNRGRVLSKTQILTQVWGYDAYDPNLVETYVSSLRRKLDAATGRPRLIHTVRGLGYRLGEAA